MTTINLKDFYYWYIVDELVEVPDEVAEALMASRRDEASYQRRLTRNKAFYSLAVSYTHLTLPTTSRV